MQPHNELPDDTSRTEGGAVSTEFQPGTGRTLKIGASVAAGILAFCFCAVMVLRLVDARTLRMGADAAYSAPPPVDVITARPASVGQDLVLPGQTAAWYETTIYARVSGYVAKWMVDIGDHVKKGQLLAVIDDPELQQQLASMEATLAAKDEMAKSAEATVSQHQAAILSGSKRSISLLTTA